MTKDEEQREKKEGKEMIKNSTENKTLLAR